MRAEDLTVQSESSKSAMSPLITRALPVLLASSPTAVAAAALTSLAISRIPVYACERTSACPLQKRFTPDIIVIATHSVKLAPDII